MKSFLRKVNNVIIFLGDAIYRIPILGKSLLFIGRAFEFMVIFILYQLCNLYNWYIEQKQVVMIGNDGSIILGRDIAEASFLTGIDEKDIRYMKRTWDGHIGDGWAIKGYDGIYYQMASMHDWESFWDRHVVPTLKIRETHISKRKQAALDEQMSLPPTPVLS